MKSQNPDAQVYQSIAIIKALVWKPECWRYFATCGRNSALLDILVAVGLNIGCVAPIELPAPNDTTKPGQVRVIIAIRLLRRHIYRDDTGTTPLIYLLQCL